MTKIFIVLLALFNFLQADDNQKCQKYDTTQTQEYVECLQHYATQSDLSAMKRLANFYYAGPSSYKDYQKAVEWYTKASVRDVPSQHALGQIYVFGGYGIKKDYKKAAYWYEKAMNNGSLGGMVNMANFYVRGLGVKQNCKKALALYQQAAEKNFWPAQDSLGHLYFEGKCVPKNIDKAKNWIRKGHQNGNTNTWFWNQQSWGPIE